MSQRDEREPERVVVTDRRRLDPETGTVRAPAGAAPAGASPPGVSPAGAHAADAAAQDGQLPGSPYAGGSVPLSDVGADAGAPGTADQRVAELTVDLQRLSAEYANYRRRVERDRMAVVETATAGVLAELLPVLDDVDRARAHGDLTGAFKSVGDALETLTARLGLERYGAPGEPFDPQVHEAVLATEPDASATVAVCAAVYQPGFRVRGRVLRPARVAVAEPAGSVGSADGLGPGGD